MTKSNGIVKKGDYTFWTHRFVVNDFILDFLKNRFPDSLIWPEFNKLDFFVINQGLPVEIQTTTMHSAGTPSHTGFEGKIQHQLTQNIEIYGKCWLFMDADYLKYLQTDVRCNISVNLDWMYKFIDKEKLNVLTITYDGIIEERSSKDFEFIKGISRTCELGKDSDKRILERNKWKIVKNIYNEIGITTEYINGLYDEFQKANEGNKFRSWLSKRGDKERRIANVIHASGNLENINTMFDMNHTEKGNSSIAHVEYLGLVKIVYGTKQSVVKQFVDIYDVAQYFPGYMRNKESWDYLKESNTRLDVRRFDAIIRGKVNVLDWKKLIDNGGWGNRGN